MAIAPSGTPVADVLIDAYNRTRCPNEFEELPGEPIEPPTAEAGLLKGLVGRIPFSPYWGQLFEEYRHTTGIFAVRMFGAVKQAFENGQNVMQAVAQELGSNYGELILEADLDLPGLDRVPLAVPRLSSLAVFMLERREQLAEGLTGSAPEPISDSWVRFTHSLVVQDEAKHDQVATDLSHALLAGEGAARARAEELALFGDVAPFGHIEPLCVALARSLGSHFPELVISRLTDPLSEAGEVPGRRALIDGVVETTAILITD